MAFVMVYGMESYNHIVANTFSLSAFTVSLFELAWLMTAVIVLQTFAGAPLARKIAFSFINPETANPKFVVLAMQISTVLIMCPLMSFVAALAFKNGLHGNTVEIWLKTIVLNFPAALLWQILVAGPVVRFVVDKVKK